MKILYIAHRIPYPPNKGDKIRTFNEIKYLSSENEVHLITLADDPNDIKHTDSLKKYCKKVSVTRLNKLSAKVRSMIALVKNIPLTVGYFYLKDVQKIVDSWLAANQYDAIICFSSPMAEYVFKSSAKRDNNHVLIMDYCDVDSQKWDQYTQQSRFPLNMVYQIEKNRLFEYEKIINQRFDHSVFVSQIEANLFKSIYPSAQHVKAISNGVDFNYFSPNSAFERVQLKEQDEQKVLVFTGAMDYYANIDGVVWFCHEIFPIIKNEFPDIFFYIVGSNPTKKVKELESIQGVKVTGFVDDIRPYYHYSDVFVAPLRIAAGVQNKVLEAMSMEKPVVTTIKAFDGIQGQPREHAIVEDNPEQFANAVINLLVKKIDREQLSKNAREFVINNYNWHTNMNKLKTLCASVPL